MRTVADILPMDPVAITPDSRVEGVIHILLDKNMDGVPVFQGKTLVGMVFYKHIIDADRETQIAGVMDVYPSFVSSKASVLEAADVMVRANVTQLPVVGEEGACLGVITSHNLLSELRRPIDPLTDLALADSLREWAGTQLKNGFEITILFFDVDRFGQFNKQYGHVIGDIVLKKVAQVLRHETNHNLDFASRYGGDEFCIASLRSPAETTVLANQIVEGVNNTRFEHGSEQLGVTFGQSGGQRAQERDAIHLAATVNNLITLASQNCMTKKF